jgi:hypothetical protein
VMIWKLVQIRKVYWFLHSQKHTRLHIRLHTNPTDPNPNRPLRSLQAPGSEGRVRPCLLHDHVEQDQTAQKHFCGQAQDDVGVFGPKVCRWWERLKNRHHEPERCEQQKRPIQQRINPRRNLECPIGLVVEAFLGVLEVEYNNKNVKYIREPRCEVGNLTPNEVAPSLYRVEFSRPLDWLPVAVAHWSVPFPRITCYDVQGSGVLRVIWWSGKSQFPLLPLVIFHVHFDRRTRKKLVEKSTDDVRNPDQHEQTG